MVLGVEMTAKLMTTAALATTSTERIFCCADGLQLAAQCYRPSKPSRHKVLMLHGWLDNCRSFWKLAPHLHDRYDVVALDFPGHGKSGHKAKDGTPSILAEGMYYIADVLQQLEWKSDDNVTLVGHSMGAAMALGYAATFPEQVHQLILLEGAGPLAREASDTTKHLRAHIEKRLRGNAQLYGDNDKGPRVYPSVQKAAETRQASAKLAPGKQYLSLEAATELVQRAVTPKEGGGVSFHHDARLMWPSLLYMTNEQVEALQRAIQCPTCLLLAEDGWPFDAQRLEDTKERLGLTHFATLPGSHHFHADPETADEVAQQVLNFMQENTTAA